MKRVYHIEMINGERFNYELQPEDVCTPIEMLDNEKIEFLGIPFDGGTIYLNVKNMISISEREDED